ncbi:MAG: hypothetical protein SVV80_13960 [Planctomycetota bacterium]|nr:hypothetical protein [Planctomycetota bacterium]
MKSIVKADRPIPDPDLAGIVARCSAKPAMMEELRRIYENADRDIADTEAVCLGGGNCCKFDLFCHRLFLTPVELALLVSSQPPDKDRILRKRCPYQIGPRCSAYHRRALGCRIFFCRAEKQRFEELYEKYHREIQALHESYCIPYSYGELTTGLMQLLSNE